MKTHILSVTSVRESVKILERGDLLAFPTETVYGLGADARNPDAVAKIFAAKGRPADNPLIVHFHSIEQIMEYAQILFDLEKKLLEKLTPGPITLLLKNTFFSSLVTAGLDTVGVRIPSHELALDLLRTCAFPLAAPSANLSGRPSPTTAQMVLNDMDGKIAGILDGGPCGVGVESTVVRVMSESEIVIYRPGFITFEDLQDCVGPSVKISYAQGDQYRSPGTRYRHYAPGCRICVIEDNLEKLLKDYTDQHKKIGILATQEYVLENYILLQDFHTVILDRGSRHSLIQAAQRLYQSYVKADQIGLDVVLVEQLPEHGLGRTLMNRVRKSAE